MSLAAKAGELARIFPVASCAEAMDDQLAMIFLCPHPAVPREARAALTLKTVCGFSTAEIARAFLIQETAVAQRIVRAKRLVRDLSFDLPEPAELTVRRESVLEVLYLMFNEGYTRGAADLCEEAIRLGSWWPTTPSPAVPKPTPCSPSSTCNHRARLDAQGDLFLLADQDRSLWDRARTSAGLRRLGRSAAGDRMTAYHLEAAIAAAHATAPDFASTDWRFIVHQYDQLYALNPSPVIALNRAVAILRALAAIREHPALARYYLLATTEARLCEELGDGAGAAAWYVRALECQCPPAERRFLERQMACLRHH